MPRPPKFIHPLRIVRLHTSYRTQDEFAKLIGVSRPTVQALENGKLKLTGRLAARIRAATGAAEKELLQGTGVPKTAEGKPYSIAFFENWHRKNRAQTAAEHVDQTDASNLTEWTRILLDAAREGPGLEKLAAARMLVAEELDQIQGKLQLLNAINSQLVPYQQVSSKTAEVAQWKREKPRAAAALGWSAKLPFASRTQLTLSVQLSPSWAPTQPSPDTHNANLDLLPASYFCLGLGKAGCEIAHLFAKQLCREHGIHEKTGKSVKYTPGGNWSSFFRKIRTEESGERFVPRFAFLDLDQAFVGELAGRNSDLFHPGGFLTGDSGSGNLFAASRGEEGAVVAARGVHFIHRQSEDTGGPSALVLFMALEGGTGTGLAEQMIRRLKEANPSLPILVVAVLPSPNVSHIVTGPYNACLGLELIISRANQCLLFDNQLLMRNAIKLWKIPAPELRQANELIIEILLAATGPLRFPSPLHSPWRIEDFLNIHPQAPRGEGREAKSCCLLNASAVPLRSLVPGKATQGTPQTLMKAFVENLPLDPLPGAPLGLFLRGRSPHAHGVPDSSVSVPHIHLMAGRPLFSQQSCTVLGQSSSLPAALGKLADQARLLLDRQAFLHWYREAGIGAPEIESAISCVRGQL